MRNKKGISLIVLIITIIVVVIIAASVMLNVTTTDLMSQANKAVLLNDIQNFETELDQYVLKNTLDESGYYDSKKLDASNIMV